MLRDIEDQAQGHYDQAAYAVDAPLTDRLPADAQTRAEVHALLAIARELAALRLALAGDSYWTDTGGAVGAVAECIERYVGGVT